uniref:Tail protein n=1 Tax=viral metagenome TaxID=1070528 RepID=A0A6H1ZJ70_9ZZZZ
MTRYLDGTVPSTIYFDFPTRADFSKRIEYFEDFILGGGRDKLAYGLTRITPQLTVTYDLNGLKFLQYAMGSLGTTVPVTISVAATLPTITFRVRTDDGTMSIHDAKVDSWQVTIEEGNPVRGEFTVIGRTIGAVPAAPFSPDFANMPITPDAVTLRIGGAVITEWTRLNVGISSAIAPIFSTSSIPIALRETGVNVTGRIRAPKYFAWASEGSMELAVAALGTIILPNTKFTEVPPRVTGFDLPETEISFKGYPTAAADAIRAVLINTIKW